MEVFAVAHEYAHFVSEERIPQFTGSLDPSHSCPRSESSD